MGGKARTIFGAALGIAAIYLSGGVATGAVSAWVAGAAQAVAVTYGAWAAREARRKAQNAAGAALEDRKTMLRGGSIAKSIVYGQAWMSGVIVYVREAKSKTDPFFWLVLALPIAHKIEAIEEVWFGDQPVSTGQTPLDANGFPTGGPFLKRLLGTHVMQGYIPAGNVIIAPGELQEASEVIQVFENTITCSVAPTPNYQPTGEDTYQDRIRTNENAYLLTGTRDRIYIPGAVGEFYTLTYQYFWNRPFMRIWRYLGTDTQVAHYPLIEACAGPSGVPSDLQWNPSCHLRGIPYIVMKMHVDPDVFPRDLENITVRIKGKNDILDTRTGVAGYHENSMLIARDYAITQCGVLPGEIHLPNFAAEVNACEELINEPNPQISPERPQPTVLTRRYTTHAVLATEVPPVDNLGLILSSCDGSAVWSGASFDLRCGRYEEPLVVLDDSDLASAPEIIKSPPRMELFNAVRARYVNSDKRFWPLEDAPGYYSDFYRIQDGGKVGEPEDRRITREIDLPATIYTVMAQRIMKQMLHRARAPLRVRAVFDIKALRLSPEQTVWLSLRSLGMAEKPFRIKSMRPSSPSTVEMELQEDGPLLYQWNFNEAAGLDPAPNSNLQSVRDVPLLDGMVVVTSGAVASFGPDGDLTAQCLVYWTKVTDPLVLNGGRIEIRYKRSQDADFTYSPSLLPYSTEFRFPIKRGDVLLVEGRCANSLVRGAWTSRKKIADDAPTPPINSNWLKNAKLEGAPGGPGPNMAGWGKPVPQAGTTIDEYYVNLAISSNAAAAVMWRTVGTIGTVSYARSDPVPVIPGDRMAASCFINGKPFSGAPGCFISLLIVWYATNGTQLSVDNLGKASGTETLANDFISRMKELRGFRQVPIGAANARLVLMAEAGLPYNNLIGEINEFYAGFYHPYLGGASEAQITWLPWSS